MMPRALRAASGPPVGSRNAENVDRLVKTHRHFQKKVRFWAPFWAPVDFEGGPKIAFLVIMLEKNKKKEVLERFQKKHEMFMEF